MLEMPGGPGGARDVGRAKKGSRGSGDRQVMQDPRESREPIDSRSMRAVCDLRGVRRLAGMEQNGQRDVHRFRSTHHAPFHTHHLIRTGLIRSAVGPGRGRESRR